VTVVAALGDSFTCGEGVGVRIDPDDTWAALLAMALPEGRLVRLAQPGARIADVHDRQVPFVPDDVGVITLLVGLNDAARAGFRPATVSAQLLDLVAALHGRADIVLLGRLHDPAALLPLPPRIADATRQRLATLNDAIDTAAGWPGVRVLDLARVPVLGQRGGWSVDRIHPSTAGHQGMAAAALTLLIQEGWPVPRPVEPGPVPPGPSRRASGWWAVRHGLPYATGHLRELGAPLVSAVLHRR
jgi:lysophospholipase L1-like esterase